VNAKPTTTALDMDVWGGDLDEDRKYRAQVRAASLGLEPCERCGRGIVAGRGWWVEVTGGGGLVVLAGASVDTEDRGYMGHYLLGAECAKRVPLAYRRQA